MATHPLTDEAFTSQVVASWNSLLVMIFMCVFVYLCSIRLVNPDLTKWTQIIITGEALMRLEEQKVVKMAGRSESLVGTVTSQRGDCGVLQS